MWASVIGGAGLAIAGGALIWRGAKRRNGVESIARQRALSIDRTFTVANKAPKEVYGFWRNLENLPSVVGALDSVKAIDSRRSHWVAKGPAGVPVTWDAEITNDRPGRLIEWRSVPGSTLDLCGIVRFKRKQGGGTKVHLSIRYRTPGGAIGETLANLFRVHPEEKVDTAVQELRDQMARA